MEISILIVDDHGIVREGLKMLLEEEPSMRVVGEASNGHEAVRKVMALKPDVVLMDLVMPELDGVGAMRKIQESGSPSRVLVLTSFADEKLVRDAILAGATGYLLKDVLRDELVAAIRSAAVGVPTLHSEAQRYLMRQVSSPGSDSLIESLTSREMDVLRLIASGSSNKEIASELGLTEGTIKGYVSSVLAKLGVSDRTQAALFAVKTGLL